MDEFTIIYLIHIHLKIKHKIFQNTLINYRLYKIIILVYYECCCPYINLSEKDCFEFR